MYMYKEFGTQHSVTAQSIVPFYERKALKENVTLNSVETSYIYLVKSG